MTAHVHHLRRGRRIDVLGDGGDLAVFNGDVAATVYAGFWTNGMTDF
ncbi:MAG: hypothetical protein R2873_22820 [Caldilineaceae bacterium]